MIDTENKRRGALRNLPLADGNIEMADRWQIWVYPGLAALSGTPPEDISKWFYPALQDIRAEMEATGYFSAGVFTGQEARPRAAAGNGLCIIRLASGFAPDSNRVEGLIQVMAQLYEPEDVEQAVNASLLAAARALRELDRRKAYQLQPSSFSADSDAFSPARMEFPAVPPFGAWRLDVRIIKII